MTLGRILLYTRRPISIESGHGDNFIVGEGKAELFPDVRTSPSTLCSCGGSGRGLDEAYTSASTSASSDSGGAMLLRRLRRRERGYDILVI